LLRDNVLIGDPVEKVALKAIDWNYIRGKLLG